MYCASLAWRPKRNVTEGHAHDQRNQMMKNSSTRCFATGAALACLAWVLPLPSASAEDKRPEFSLVRAVPHDVFMCIAGRPNPQRQFLDDYWGEVVTAFHKSGIMNDVLALVESLVGADEMAEANRLKDRFTELFNEVDWESMFGGEMVFAERLPLASRHGHAVMMGQPELVVLFRVGHESAEEHFTELAAIGRAFADVINEKSNKKIFRVEEVARKDGLRRFSLGIAEKEKAMLSMGVGLHGDVISLSLGEELFEDVAALLSGKSDKRSIASDPRFKAAFAELPAASDSISFFDMRCMCERMKCNFNTLFAAMEGMGRGGDVWLNALQTPETQAFNAKAIAAYRKSDYATALAIIKKAHEVAPKDSLIMYNLACFHALNGNRDVAMDWLERSVEGGFYGPRQISTDPDLVTLREDPRYKAALAKAEKLAAQHQAKSEKNVARKLVTRVWDAMDVLDHIACVTSTEEHATRMESIAVLAEDAKSKAIYPVIASGEPIKDFDRYLPKETVSFSVSSGIDLDALYGFLETSVRELGDPGEKAWQQWKLVQEQIGFKVRKDLLSWLDTDVVSVTMDNQGASAWVGMVRVKDESVAREKMQAGMTFLSNLSGKMAKQNPMLGMLTVRTQPSAHERLEGFQTIHMAMLPQPLVYGVKDEFLVVGSGEEAVARCFATAAGEHPNIRENERLMSEALTPIAPVHSISFSDQRDMGKEMADILQALAMGMGMAGMTVPDPKAQQTLGRVTQIIGKLGPVVRKIDFFKSTSTYTTFDGRVWRTRSITHYKSPTERATARSQL